MEVANNALSRKLEAHFRSKGAERLWKGKLQCVENEEFRKEVKRIQALLLKKYPNLIGKERGKLSIGFFVHLIIPDPKDQNKPWRLPRQDTLLKLCDVLGWDFTEIWIDQNTHINIEDLDPVRQKIIHIASNTQNPQLLSALSSMVDALADKEPSGRLKKDTINDIRF